MPTDRGSIPAEACRVPIPTLAWRGQSEADHDPPRQCGRDAVDELKYLHHPRIDLALAGPDAADDLGGTVVRAHLLARPARGHVRFDDGGQRLDDPDIAVLEQVADRLRIAAQPRLGRAIDRPARARRARAARCAVDDPRFGL